MGAAEKFEKDFPQQEEKRQLNVRISADTAGLVDKAIAKLAKKLGRKKISQNQFTDVALRAYAEQVLEQK